MAHSVLRERPESRRGPVRWINVVAVAILLVWCAIALWGWEATANPAAPVAAVLIGLALMQSPRVAHQWERAVVLRLGRFVGLRGPGLFWIVPFLDRVSAWVDQRTVTTSFAAELVIPDALQDAMSREAQASREKQARVILGEAEMAIANSFQEAAKSYQENPTALHLRAMNMLYEGLKEKGALMLVPSSAVESMGMGGLMGAAALRQSRLAGSDDTGTVTSQPPA